MPSFFFRRKFCSRRRGRCPSVFKRKQKAKVQIDHLPQELVEMVVSFLPMKDAARTSVLSSKWRQGWASYPRLTLNSETMLGITGKVDYASEEEQNKYKMKFIENVHAVMRQHQGFGVDEFLLEFGLSDRDAHHIDNWVSLAASMRMKRLVIDLSGLSLECKIVPEKYALPLQLLDDIGTIKHLRNLQLSNLSLKPLGDFGGFVNLTMLELQLVDVTEGDLESLLCKCPALERLALNTCGPFMSLRIGHQLSRLEHLCLGDGTLVEKLKIEAMNLRTISHSYNVGEIVVRKDSQISEVTADMNIPPRTQAGNGYKDTLQYMFTGLPSALPCVRKVSLNIWEGIQTLEVPKCASSFTHLRHLTLSMYLRLQWKFDILRLVHLLQAAPFLEHFELNIDELLLPLYDEDLIPSIPRWPHDHLKTALFQGFVGNHDLIALAIYILNNAESLKLMNIQTKTEGHRLVAEELLRVEDLRRVLNIL
ncbi:hypothetical protein QYE76_070032 [Lolium multiflorum]|uniref:F-box domain-containing protein n=1 Tax=Lolium multiflorum TaxID=4521 RepID=A0AAD8SJE2_LOLMU|nr:hypothetical protein QYE76_070032 [Lolium multiflorum]